MTKLESNSAFSRLTDAEMDTMTYSITDGRMYVYVCEKNIGMMVVGSMSMFR